MKTIKYFEVTGKRILIRADFNVPLKDGDVADDFRIRAAVPTIDYLTERKARVIVCSHLGRPKGERHPELSLTPIAAHLADLLPGREVSVAPDCVGDEVRVMVEAMNEGEVLLLENLRFHPEEKENDRRFAQQLASLADMYVNDAFSVSHRAHASTSGVTRHLPSVAGLSLIREIKTLSQVRDDPEHPSVAILGGAKISGKLEVMGRLLERVDKLLVGGGIANTFLKAAGKEVGESLVENELVEEAKRILESAGDKLILPVDVVVARPSQGKRETVTVSSDAVSTDDQILDIGEKTVQLFQEQIAGARTVFWNGPMGKFEDDEFANGTRAIARLLGEAKGMTVAGGGETVTAIRQAGVAENFDHISTGGGALLEFMEGKELPGIRALEENKPEERAA